MNPNYFYDLKYISPFGGQMYEYSKSTDSVDFSAFYHEDMWERGLLDDSSRKLIEQYTTVPVHDVFKAPIGVGTGLGLEFDCGSKLPALFAKLHLRDTEYNQQVFNSITNIVGLDNSTIPSLPNHLVIEDVGIFPERATGLLRLLLRGPLAVIKQFVDDNGCVNTDIINQSTNASYGMYGLSFDWDGVTMTNFMFHSASIHLEDPWVVYANKHAKEHIADLLGNQKYTINSFVKVGLSPNIPADYMKAYFTVRFY